MITRYSLKKLPDGRRDNVERARRATSTPCAPASPSAMERADPISSVTCPAPQWPTWVDDATIPTSQAAASREAESGGGIQDELKRSAPIYKNR
jgi:hypothetical protein